MVVAVTGIALSGCASTPEARPTPKPFDVEGTITVPMDISASLPLQDGKPTVGNPCIPKAGYSDISEGAQVIVTDSRDEKIAIGEVGAGALANGPSGSAFFQSVCEYPFSVEDVPNESKIFSVHIGNDARGEQSFTKTELEDGVALSLG